ncbi:MAG: M48 family metallopeptidase [Chromatiales bacterium]|nr:MAG: M48 family metallopeptidase [Chromatiales bacterium]
MAWLYRIGLLVLVLAGSGCAVPIISERELQVQSDAEFQKMRNQMVESRDARVRGYVQCVSDAILAEVQQPYASLNWEVVVFDDEAVNAFALPGGQIGVFTGLLKVAENQDQLAAVIGHEVAHVTERHSYEQVNRQVTTQAGVYAGAAVLGGGQTTYDLLSMGAQIGITLPYGRGAESEADVVGLRYMAEAGFDPRASVQLWKNMDAKGGASPPEFLSTHPSSGTRISGLIALLPEALDGFNAARAEGKRPDCRR